MADWDTVQPRPKILVVEDSEEIAELLQAVLVRAGMDVTLATTGPDGLRIGQQDEHDVVLLDVNLPGLDGVEVCRRLRTTSDAYVLMLTARDDELDRIVGLSVGADDYVTKPFSPRELEARVQALLRRPRSLRGSAATADASSSADLAALRMFGDVRIDLDARQVQVAETPVTLTKLEFDLLAALTEHPRRVVTRGQLRDLVWGGDWLADDHAVDVHMSNLHRKLRLAGADRLIATVRGVGYRIAADAG